MTDGTIAPGAGGDAGRELEAARRISEALFESPDPDEVIERALDVALEVLDAEGGSILIADPKTRTLVFRHSVGTRPVPVGTAMPWDRGIGGHVFRSGTPIAIGDVTHDSHHFKAIDEMTHFTTRDMIAAPLRRWDGEPIGVIEVLNKRTGAFDSDDVQLLLIVSAISATAIERARLNEEAKLAEMSRLFGHVSHDVKNLLTPVVLGSEILETTLDAFYKRLGDEDREALGRRYEMGREIIGSLATSGGRIQELLKEVSDCIAGSAAEPAFSPCSVAAIAGEVFDAVKAVARQANVVLATEGLEPLPEIDADGKRLFNALYNLVNNAIGAMPEGGTLTISGRDDAGHGGVRLSVTDTGTGMPPEVAARLFMGGARSRKRLGSGLGVRIVKDVIDAHHGTIEVRSEVGAGTTFDIFLPRVQPGE